jgi:outer membrane protein assembly factor BamA
MSFRPPALLPAVLIVVRVLLFPPAVPAQAGPVDVPVKTGQAAVEAFKPRLIAIPFLYYSPETKLAFGGGGVLTFRAGRKKAETRASSVWAFGTYNLARQFQVVVKPEIYFSRNSFFLSGNLRYERTPQKFFGVGNDMPGSAEESYTPRVVTVQVGVKKKFLGHLFAGVQYEFEQMTMEKLEPGGVLETGEIPGSRGGQLSGFGASLDWDTRDAVIFPRKGVFLQFTADTYGAMTGSDFTFTGLKFDFRKYVPVATDQVLAIQALFRSGSGEVPFHKLALLGGESLLRGYYRGRYRDRDILAVQAEYRVTVWKRIGVAGFAGVADVFPRLAEFRLDHLKYSAGTGVRYMVNKREGTNLRMDMAWGKGSFGLYFTAQEAF